MEVRSEDIESHNGSKGRHDFYIRRMDQSMEGDEEEDKFVLTSDDDGQIFS